MLCSKTLKNKKVIFPNDADRRDHHTGNGQNENHRTDENLTDRIQKFQNQLKNEYVYRIPPKYLCDLGLNNQCFTFNTKYILTLETEIQKVFQTNINQAADTLSRNVDTEIIITSTPYIMYEQFKLDDNSRTYLEGVMLFEHVLRTEIKPTPYQKSFELVIGTESRVVNFQVANKQFFSCNLISI